MAQDEKILEISWKTILKVSLMLVLFYVVFLVKEILVWFLFSVIISILFNPAVDFLQKKRVPRTLAIFLVYLLIFGFLIFLVYLMVPLFIGEIQQFLKNFPEFFEKISPPLQFLGFEAFRDIKSFLEALGSGLEGMTSNIFSALFSFFGGVFSGLFIITMAIFLSLEEKMIDKVLVLVFPKKYEAVALSIWAKCQKKVAGWFGARLLSCLFVGIISYAAFLIFRVKYPAILGFLAGVLNFVPFVGPLLTGVLLFLIVFPTGLLRGIFVLVAFGLIQHIENNILSPILMKRFVGLPPALVLISLVIGAEMWGVLGGILIIPLAGILFEFLKEFLHKRKEKDIIPA